MNHKHREVPHALFAHPVSADISTRSVETVLRELGGKIDQRHGGRMGVKLNGHFAEFSHPSHSLQPTQVRQMSKFIIEAGIDPEQDYPL